MGKEITRPVYPKKHQKFFSTLQLEDLPNELIHRAFRFLNIVELLKCAEVSKRFCAISNDDHYLWAKKLNLCYKKVSVEFLQRLLDSGCKYLSLSGAVLQSTPNFPTASFLKYLNLAGFGLKNNPEKILKSCFSLQKRQPEYNRQGFWDIKVQQENYLTMLILKP